MGVHERLRDLGITLPQAPPAVGAYATQVRSGALLFLSGHLPRNDGAVVRGRVGEGVSVLEAARAAELCALEILATIESAAGLDSVARVVKLTGFVNATADITEHSQVVNGASDLLVRIFGEDHGIHARSAVGVAGLPLGAVVEIEAVIELRP